MVSTGTGIVLTADGYIVTNAHIIAGAEQVNVTLSDDSLWSAQLVGFEPLEDLAVLKIDASGLTPAQFGDDTLLRSGDPVSAIGNPMGYRSTITPGIVSALDQPVSVEGTTMYLLQTSAAINYGSSGGALLNDRGQVVGVTTIKIVADDGSAEGWASPSPPPGSSRWWTASSLERRSPAPPWGSSYAGARGRTAVWWWRR